MIIGISGPSGSGKTTIARALRQVYASHGKLCRSVQILHQDDFYKPEHEIPKIETRAGSVVNWDCPEAIDMASFIKTLQSYRAHDDFPKEIKQELEQRSKEDKNDVSETGVSEILIKKLYETDRIPSLNETLLIVDGFMLYHSSEVLKTLDIAILLRGSFEKLRARRESRSGYVTLEGFWKDPDGYFPDCVWPEYVATHGQFFANEDVHSSPKAQAQIAVSDILDMSLNQSFEFVIDSIRKHAI